MISFKNICFAFCFSCKYECNESIKKG